MGVISGSGGSVGDANTELDIYNIQFSKYQPKLKHEKKLRSKARGFQKKLDKLNKAIARVDRKTADIEKKIAAQQKKCKQLADDCGFRVKHPAKTSSSGGYGNGNGGYGYDEPNQNEKPGTTAKDGQKHHANRPVTGAYRQHKKPGIGQKPSATKDAYWLDKKHGGHEFDGATVCKACSHLLSDLRSGKDKLRAAKSVETNAQKSLSEQKAKNTSGLTLQQKYRLSEDIKHAQRELKRLRSRRGKAGRALNRSQIKLATCRKKHCKASAADTALTQQGFRDYGDNALTEDEPRQPKEKKTAKEAGKCKACAALFKQYMALSKKIQRIEADWWGTEGPEGGPHEPKEYQQRREVKKKLDQCLKQCEAKKKAAAKQTEKIALPSDNGTCIQGAVDIAKPINRKMPDSESAGNKTKSAIGHATKEIFTGLTGMSGRFSGIGRTGGKGGAQVVRKPKGPWDVVESGDISLKFSGWEYNPHTRKIRAQIRIGQRITDSPDNGGPDNMWFQDRNGNVLRPVGYMVFELWRHWKLTITITRDTWMNGVHTSHSVTRESTSWNELADRYKVLLEAPSIWEQLQSRPFDQLRGVIVEFDLPENFDPTQWSLITHITSKVKINGKEAIRTIPVVLEMSWDKKHKHLRFHASPDGKTRYLRNHPGCLSLFF